MPPKYTDEYTGYCLNCGDYVQIQKGQIVALSSKHGIRKAVKGKCPFCHKGVFRILGKLEENPMAEQPSAPEETEGEGAIPYPREAVPDTREVSDEPMLF